MRSIGSPETSVLNQPKLRNIPDDDRIQVNRSESLPSRFSSSNHTILQVMPFHIPLSLRRVIKRRKCKLDRVYIKLMKTYVYSFQQFLHRCYSDVRGELCVPAALSSLEVPPAYFQLEGWLFSITI